MSEESKRFSFPYVKGRRSYGSKKAADMSEILTNSELICRFLS